MTLTDPMSLGLGDFFYTDSDRILDPGDDYAAWKRAANPVFGLFEPALASGPFPRTDIKADTGTIASVNLSSYNYLGLGQHPEVIRAAQDALAEFGTGACGSPVLSGMTVLHRKLEQALAAFLKRDATMLFNSGNAGAIGALSAVLRRGDVAILDQYAHICLIEGVKLAGARVEMFRHNDPDDLADKLEKHAGKRRLVIVEGLYSMHGDFGALDRLVPVAKAAGVDVMVDEAHSILASGAHGRGAAEMMQVEQDVALSYGTFSKAFAGAGAVLAGPQDAMDYIRYFANTYVFSVALPPATVAGVTRALEIATVDASLRDRLWKNAAVFRDGLHSLGISTAESNSYIVPMVIGSNRALLYEITAGLRAAGVFVAPVDYPSVPEDQLRLRSCVTAAHTPEDLATALSVIEHVVVPLLKRHGAA